MEKPTTYDQFYSAVKNKNIASAKDKSGKTHRLFISTSGFLCAFLPRSSRRGSRINPMDFDNFVSVQEPKAERTDAEKEKAAFREIDKYRSMAEKASFSNKFIEKCKALPKSFTEWVVAGKKSLFEYNVTTGNKIDGTVISIDSISKQFPHSAESLRNAIHNKTVGKHLSCERFRGYDCSISTEIHEGKFCGYLSLEFKGCGNGYYYLLINDENFIGYDVD